MKRIVQPLLEDIPLPGTSSVAVREFNLPAFTLPWHRHPEVELTWIMEGEGLRHVGDNVEPFCAGDFCLIGANLPHCWLSTRPPKSGMRARSLVVQFDPARFGAPFWALPECTRIARLLERAAQGLCFSKSLGERLAATWASATTPILRMTALLALLGELSETPEERLLSLAAWTQTDRAESDPKLRRVLAYLGENMGETISQAAVARLVHMSPAAFSRFFRRAMGKTFQSYLTGLRLGVACRQLLETDRRVSEIAYAVGFGNLSNFNRAFRQSRGVSPREFRLKSWEATSPKPTNHNIEKPSLDKRT
ncbi:MAG: AraC family transcriptional regulator [Rariglobus sp.]|jgi:AraC-like DNA-binding protein|nr:AraC family transcriptional regulator [Rariglobus sp.]